MKKRLKAITCIIDRTHRWGQLFILLTIWTDTLSTVRGSLHKFTHSQCANRYGEPAAKLEIPHTGTKAVCSRYVAFRSRDKMWGKHSRVSLRKRCHEEASKKNAHFTLCLGRGFRYT